MCFKLSSETAIERNIMENKSRFTKAVMNIIQKLRTTTGSKREKYMSKVRKEFKLEKNEKWVITKLRMMLVRLDASMEQLQIRKSANSKLKKIKVGTQESFRNNI